jgi:hypothetical protein
MIARFAFFLLLLSHIARAAEPSLEPVHSGEGLARFIFSMTTGRPVFADLLRGLESSNVVRIASYDSPIPVREIYGTIVEEKFYVLPYESGKHHSVREICSFLHSDGLVYRYHITVYEDREYRLMSDFLKARMARKTKPNKSGARAEVNPEHENRGDTF